jgi:hypothetical protein
MAEGKRPGAATGAGVLEIIFGAWGAIAALITGLLGSLFSAAGSIVTSAAAELKMSSADVSNVNSFVSAAGPILIVFSIVMLALGIIGLIAGILVLTNKKSALKLSQVYIWGSIIFTVATFIIKIIASMGVDVLGLIVGAVVPVVIFILIIMKPVKEFYAKA